MKIFISMGFKGRTDEEVMKRREEIIKIIKERYHFVDDFQPGDIMDTFVKEVPESLTGYNESIWCLGDSIRMMAFADLVVFDYDWEAYQGCCVEKEVVIRYHKKYAIITKDDNIMFFV